MNTRDKIKKAWDRLEATVGKIDDKTRQEFEEIFGIPPTISDSVFVQEFIDEINKSRKLIEIAHRLRRMKTDEGHAIASRKIGAKAAKIATQRFQRRVGIAEFVLFSIYTFKELYIPLANNELPPKKRINWKETITEWNQTHPSDPMTNTHVFRTTFYRILREDEVLKEILRREFAEERKVVKLWQSARSSIEQFEQSEEFQKLPSSIKEEYYRNIFIKVVKNGLRFKIQNPFKKEGGKAK